MMLKFIFVFFVGMIYAQSGLDTAAYCSLPWQCMKVSVPRCSENHKKPIEDVQYTQEFCEPLLNSVNRGLSPTSVTAMQVNSHLGKRLRVIYEVKGRLPVNMAMMDYLMNHMPFTANLINAYQKSSYTLAYTYGDKWYFHGDNGRNLKGQFQWISNDSSGVSGRNLFWGKGSAKVLMWKLWGVALVTLDYDPVDANHIDYRLRSIVFPANGFLTSIMEMDLFRSVVLSKMREIVGHVENSASQYAQGDRAPIRKSLAFTKEPWLARQLSEFDQVVKKSGYSNPKKSSKP